MPQSRPDQPTTALPNVIVCMCDELRAFETGCYGNSVIRTPHIDRMASEGARFELAVSNEPLCMPARSAVMSGQYSRTCTGSLDNFRNTTAGGRRYGLPLYPVEGRPHLPDPTLAEQLADMGYHTAAIGKWHIHSTPEDVGFDYSLIPRTYHRHTSQHYRESGGPEILAEDYAPDWEAQRVTDFLRRQRDSRQPFFLYYNIMPPHMPLMDAPAYYREMYSSADVPLRPNVYCDGALPFDDFWVRTYLWDFYYHKLNLPHTQTLPEGTDLRLIQALYYGMTTWVDDLLGRVLDCLDEEGLARNTVVLFTSDHGDTLGSHGQWNQARLWEESIRIPFIVRWPGKILPRVLTRQVASLIDIMPTLLDLVGVEIPPSVQGTSLAPLLHGRREDSSGHAFIETLNNGIGIRTTSHMYGMKLDETNRTIVDDRFMFYDLMQDPYQQNNLIGGNEQADLAEQLRCQLELWHRDTPWLDECETAVLSRANRT